jgi:F-type H+-transporting ATPase subunit delta
LTKDLLVAYRYAQALFELSREQKADEYVEAELESLSQALKAEPALERQLGNPALKPSDKRRVIERIYKGKQAGIDETLIRFMLLLFKKNRFYLIHDVAAHFRKIADESQGQGVAEIRTASPLSDRQRDAIVSRVERISGKKMVVRTEIDASLLGGVLVKLGNKVIDDTVRTKLGNFKKELTKIQSI